MEGYDALNVNVLNVAKDEYTKQLNSILAPLILEGVDSIYNDAKKIENEHDVIHNFQLLLKEVPHWNTHIISTECQRLQNVCDWMHDLVTAVFVTNVKILTSVKIVNKSKQFKLKMPNFETFVHAVYIEAARHFFHNPFLFYEYDRVTKRNKNKKEALRSIQNNVEETIRILLPVQHILKEYMQDDGEEEDEAYQMLDKDSIKSASEIVNPNITEHSNNADSSKVKNMVQHELKQNKDMYEVESQKQSPHDEWDHVSENDDNHDEPEDKEEPVRLNSIHENESKELTLEPNDRRSKQFIESENRKKEREESEHVKPHKEEFIEDDDINDNESDLSDISE